MARRGLIALAAVEARRLLAHPFVLGGLALGAVATAAADRREGQLQAFMLMGLAVLPLALGTFAAAHLAASRSRRAGAEELLDTLPQDVSTRTAAQLLSLLAVVPLALGLLATAYLLFAAGGGLMIDPSGTLRTPALVELAQGPILVLSLGAVGVLLGRVAPFAPLGTLLVVAVLVAEVPLAAWAPDTPWRWAVPLVNDTIVGPGPWVTCEPGGTALCGPVERYDTTALTWHLLALGTVAVAAAAAALTRRRAVRAGLAAGAIALAAAATVVAA